MFNMESIGSKIASARKAHDLTQMELADRLNISFQAVSNWERGVSMPDISKLPEIAGLLEISLDDLLEATSPLIKGLASENGEDYLKTAEISPEELLEVAPILKPSQLAEALENRKESFDLKEIVSLLPFLNEKDVDELAKKAYEKEGIEAIDPVKPFMSDAALTEIAETEYQQNGLSQGVMSVVPFLDEAVIDQWAQSNINDMNPLLPFLSDALVAQLAEEGYEKGGLSQVSEFLPFLKEEKVDEIGRDIIQKHGIRGLGGILPFVSQKFLQDVALEKFEE